MDLTRFTITQSLNQSITDENGNGITLKKLTLTPFNSRIEATVSGDLRNYDELELNGRDSTDKVAIICQTGGYVIFRGRWRIPWSNTCIRK